MAGHDRVPFSRRGAHRGRSLDETVDGRSGRRGRGLLPRLSCSCASAGRFSRSSSTRATASRRRSSTRDVRVPAERPVRIHAAALRLVPRRPLLPVRPLVAGASEVAQIVVAVATALVVLRDRLAPALDRRRSRRRAHRDAAPVPDLARRPPEPRGARRTRAGSARALRARRVRNDARSRCGLLERSPASRSSATHALSSLSLAIARYCRVAVAPASSTITATCSSSGSPHSSSRPGSRATRSRSGATRSRPTRSALKANNLNTRAVLDRGAGSTTCRTRRRTAVAGVRGQT